MVNTEGSPNLIPMEMILSLKEVRAGGGKVARSLGHIDQYKILYCQGILAKTGIRVWCPDLQDAPDSLYNSACRITALKTFRELFSFGTYNYMNVQPQSFVRTRLQPLCSQSYDQQIQVAIAVCRPGGRAKRSKGYAKKL